MADRSVEREKHSEFYSSNLHDSIYISIVFKDLFVPIMSPGDASSTIPFRVMRRLCMQITRIVDNGGDRLRLLVILKLQFV